MDVLAAMQGNADGHGKGLTTYPESDEREQREAHAECLKLEAEGKVTRYIDHEHATSGTKHVIWMPVDPKAVRPAPESEEAP